MFEEKQPGILSPVPSGYTGDVGHAPAVQPGPLVPKTWAALWGAAGLALGVYAQLGAPQDLIAPAALLASVLTYLGMGEFPQPEVLRRIGRLVPEALVPGCALLATGLHQQAVAQGQPLLHVLATTVALVAGVAEQPTVGARPGPKLLALVLAVSLTVAPAHAQEAARAPPVPLEECDKLERSMRAWGAVEVVLLAIFGGTAVGRSLDGVTEGRPEVKSVLDWLAVLGGGGVALAKFFQANDASRYQRLRCERTYSAS